MSMRKKMHRVETAQILILREKKISEYDSEQKKGSNRK